ncbi:MAG: hypothetical protein ACI4VN_06735 [Clostridia bacterium]
MKEKKEKNPKTEAIKWFFTIFVVTFILSMIFSYISTTSINGLNVAPALIVLIAVILLGVLFDIIGVAITCATEEEFHAMASKKVKGAKTAIKLIRSAPKVSNICNDVIGDICGVLSGAISAMLTLKITQSLGLSFDIQFIMSALVASLTVGGKALGKSFAKNKCTTIIYAVSKVLSVFEK